MFFVAFRDKESFPRRNGIAKTREKAKMMRKRYCSAISEYIMSGGVIILFIVFTSWVKIVYNCLKNTTKIANRFAVLFFIRTFAAQFMPPWPIAFSWVIDETPDSLRNHIKFKLHNHEQNN